MFLSLNVISSFIYAVAFISISFLFIVNSISWYGYTTFSSFIHQLMDTWLFLLLVSVNNDTFNICMQVSFCGHRFSVLLGIDLRVDFLDHMVTLCLTI